MPTEWLARLTLVATAVTVLPVTTWNATTLAALSDGDIARAIAGAPDDRGPAEEELYRRFAPRVRLYGLRHLADRASADDLAQQVLILVIERLRANEVREPDQIGSFVLGTSRMMCGGMKRVDRRREGLLAQYYERDVSVAPIDEHALDVARVTPCLSAVRERERTVLMLSFYADKGAKEIGDALGMTAGAVRVCRHRALMSLRECLETRRVS
jgi:RNA polymerase sigma-70 factor (ECF subfamily)